MTVLKRLRKCRHALTGALLPVLAFVWIGAAAAPCVAMQAALSHGAPMAPPAHGHAHHGASPSLDTASSGEHMAGMHDSMPSVDEQGVQGVQGEHRSAGDPHRPCPHCPPDSGHTAPHVACAMPNAFLSADDMLTASTHDLGQVLLPVGVAPSDEALPGKGSLQRPERLRDPPPPVPLNLRYCVFLN